MKLTAARPAKPRDARQAKLQSGFAAASPLRDLFPQVAELQVDLSFAAEVGPLPSAQRYSLYPAARAYFLYRCPCTDCDGVLDLNGPIGSLVGRTPRAAARSSGQLTCDGVRLRNSAVAHPCTLKVDYQLRSVPVSAAPRAAAQK